MKIRRGSRDVSLGPLTAELIGNARWQGEDEYPSSQLYADELEDLLRFASESKRLERHWNALIDTRNHRGSILAEFRIAIFFLRRGLKIVEWEPIGLGQKAGEFLLQSSSSSEIFVEVKSPGWEGELSEEEKRGERKKQPKHIHLENRCVAPWERIQFAVGKAYEKFLPIKPNLLVIADDLFWPLNEGSEMHAREGLYTIGRGGCFTDH
ncbi:MAG: hypothetical protein MN733_24240, partial [Nitrososphaera sp.]|nr:hypothetical protein [Nitrososphaera sp.]